MSPRSGWPSGPLERHHGPVGLVLLSVAGFSPPGPRVSHVTAF
ncbi:hypothetical protein D4764_12G0003960 [Takifugu flavidus]|uniref:Uncharacterized protein n=1 Tax=Takifugu flavidus TaxID=433684 RepID=A0A5C6PCR7_9TELE|nr:hypothetical protein D4764_12G0003960 [Takifugu flavidus]